MPNRFLLSLIGLILTVSSGAQAGSPINLDVLKRDGYGVVQLFQVRQNVLTANVVINGQKMKLELDTGFSSGGLGLDTRYAGVNVPTGNDVHEATGVSGKTYQVRRGVAKTVVMGNVQLTDVPVEVGAFKVFDEEHSQKFSSTLQFDNNIANVTTPAGFIGRDFLRTNNAVIDLANHLLYLKPPGKGKKAQLSAALTKVGMGEAQLQGNLVDVEINGVAAKMVVDTGAVASLLDPRFAAKANARGYGSTNMEFSDISGAKSRVDLTGLANFKIGGVPAKSFIVTLIPFSAYGGTGGKLVGLLGIDFLGQNWGIIDFGQQKLYFARGK
jgi:predicted aspartyl protease